MPRTNNKIRGANGNGSIRKKTVKSKNGTEYVYYEARVTVGYDPLTGTQKQKSITAKSKSEVRQQMSAIIYEVDNGLYMEPSKQTVEEWLDIWLETYIKDMVKPYTEDSYRAQCKVHIKPVLGKIRLTELSPVQVQMFYNDLFRKDKLSPKSVKNIHGVLHKALGQAVKVGLIRTNPTELCDLPRGEKKEIVPLEQEDVIKFLDAIKGEKYELVYLVTLFTGLRQGEVLGLTWDCVDFEKNTLYINKQLTKTGKVGVEYCLAATETSQSRLITVAPSVMDFLHTQAIRQASKKLLAGEAWANDWNLVFTNELGGHLAHCTVYKDFKSIVRSIGLGDTRFHDLRHSFAVACLESGDDIKTVQENLGHSSAAFTMAVYAHASQKMRQRSADNMERYIKSVSQK